MRILYYNWDIIDGKTGGGVTVYQKNILSKLTTSDSDDELFFINSGLSYDFGKMRLIKNDNSFGDKVKSYEIINSPVLAPVQQSSKNISKYLEDTSIANLFDEFIKEYGPFDVIHFNNIEGLSISVFYLKEKYPNTKFIYSLHNYFPICSRVNLWKNEKNGGENCNKTSFSECQNCYIKSKYNCEMLRRKSRNLPMIFRKIFSVIIIIMNKILNDDCGKEIVYERFEKLTVKMINDCMDSVLAVSNRVKQILVSKGINQNKMRVSYIGTKVADTQMHKCIADNCSEIFHVVYMGYMNRPKGFYFLLECLERMEEKLSKNISVRLVAKYDEVNNADELEKINILKKKFYSIELINGYNESNQKNYLQDINLGIVPVLWEDNLPQVAIEQISYGVPILVSDLGGAKELVNNEKFVFKAGDHKEFLEKLNYLMQNRTVLADFWNSRKQLITLDEHIKELKSIYEE